MEVVIFAMLLGCITGLIARLKKNRSFFAWWVYGSLIFIVAIVHVLLVKPRTLSESELQESGLRACPHCAETIQIAAVVCKHCQRNVPAFEPPKIEPKHQRVAEDKLTAALRMDECPDCGTSGLTIAWRDGETMNVSCRVCSARFNAHGPHLQDITMSERVHSS